jgi:uncharacterized membrane protein
MNTTKVAIATLVGSIVNFLLGFAVWGVTLSSFFKRPVEVEALINKPDAEFSIVTMFVSCIAYVLLLAIVFEKWAGIRTFAAGASAGALFGFLISVSYDLGFVSILNSNFMTTTQMIGDICAYTVVMALTGGIVGWMLGRGRTD